MISRKALNKLSAAESKPSTVRSFQLNQSFPKLRRRLIALFLTFTMLAYTLMMALMAVNALRSLRQSEQLNLDGIAEEVVSLIFREGLAPEAILERYPRSISYFHIQGSQGLDAAHCRQAVPADALLAQMVSRSRASSGLKISEAPGLPFFRRERELYYLTAPDGSPYYGYRMAQVQEGSSYGLVMLSPRPSTSALILRGNRLWYPLIWLAMLGLMYALSRYLIGKALSPLEAALKGQRDFIAAASHELKAPLAVIQANAESAIEVAPARHLEIIAQECGAMNRLVENLLCLAASDAGRWKLAPAAVNPEYLLIEAWESYLASCRRAGVGLELSLVQESFPQICADPALLSQALGILLDNAISFSPQGSSITLEARVQGRSLIFSVIDRGPGLSPEEKSRAMERFYRGDPARSGKNHFGLGLSIASEIARLHRGSLVLSDTPGGGCTACLHLPLEAYL